MTKSKAIEKIMKDMKLPEQCEGYVIYTIGRLGCEESIDIDDLLKNCDDSIDDQVKVPKVVE